MLIFAAIPFFFDIIKVNLFQNKNKKLPSNISQLLDPKLFSRLTNKNVIQVEYGNQKEQHANSTDRAWFDIKLINNKNEEESRKIFAKIHSKTFKVRSLMCMFDVYRNEVHSYTNISWPVETPFIYAAKYTPSRFVIIMEDLSSKGCSFPNIWDTVCDKQLTENVIDTLSIIHSKWWNNTPEGCWDDKKRPYQAMISGMKMLEITNKQYPNLIPKEVNETFKDALWNWKLLRKYFSKKGPHTLCHGDSHLGNFFIQENGKIGIFDLQVKSKEHPMRDISYFLGSSCPCDLLEKYEKYFINYYLSKLEENGLSNANIPSFDDCWFRYRLQSFYTLYAFVFSAGFSNLMDKYQTEIVLKRICNQILRIDAKGALNELITKRL